MTDEGKMDRTTDIKPTHPAITLTLIAMIICLVVSLAILSAVPPVSRDALTHHLTVPKLYIQQGGIVEIPEVVFSYYPMNLELLYMMPLYFGMDILPKYIHMIFGLLSAWIIYCYLRVRTGLRVYGLIGALLFLSLPVIIKLSITVYVDLGLIFFSTASLLLLFKWSRNGFRFSHLVLAAVFCGLGLGTKYNSLISFFLIVWMVPLLISRQADVDSRPSESRKTIKALSHALAFVIISLLVFSPWMLRNFYWQGNPIYPLHQGIFDTLEKITTPDTADSQAEHSSSGEKANGGMSNLALRRVFYGESIFETLSIPVRVFFQGQDDNPRLFDGRLNPYLIILPIFAFIGFRNSRRRDQTESILLAGFSLFYLLYAFFMVDMRIRYIAPIIPTLVILAVLGLKWLIENLAPRLYPRRPTVGIGLVTGSMCLLLALNAGYLLKQFEIVKPFEYLSGRVDRDTYITRYRPEFRAIQYINAHLQDDATVLAVFIGNRIYYSDRKMISNNQLIDSALAASNSAESLAAHLRRKGFTHILIRHDLFETYDLNKLSADKRSLFKRFQQSKARTLYSDGLHGVYSIAEK